MISPTLSWYFFRQHIFLRSESIGWPRVCLAAWYRADDRKSQSGFHRLHTVPLPTSIVRSDLPGITDRDFASSVL
jgi:hypothetical protein